MNTHAIMIRTMALVVAMANILAYVWNYTRKPVFWDAEVYTRALTDLARSLDPYRLDVHNVYVYPPITLKLLSGMTPETFRLAYAALALLSVLTFMVTLIAHGREARVPPGPAPLAESTVLALGLGGVGVFAIATGNATTCLHLVLITLLVQAARDKRWAPVLMGAILAASLIKPYLLSYALAAPFVVKVKRPVIWSGAVVAMTGSVYLGYVLFEPQLMAAFFAAIQHQLKGGLDGGISVYGILCQLGLPSPWAMAWQLVYTIWICWWCLSQVRANPGDLPSRVGAVVLCAVLINPRLKEYDLFPALWLWLAFTPRWRGFGTHMLIALALTSLVLPFKVLHIDLQVHKFMLFNSGAWVFLAVNYLCWRAQVNPARIEARQTEKISAPSSS
jgi:hypothetical protein